METRPPYDAFYAVPVRQTEALPTEVLSNLHIRLPSDSASRRTPLPLANSSYCQVCSGLPPPSRCPCRAHIKKITAYRNRSDKLLLFYALFRYQGPGERSPAHLRWDCLQIRTSSWRCRTYIRARAPLQRRRFRRSEQWNPRCTGRCRPGKPW